MKKLDFILVVTVATLIVVILTFVNLFKDCDDPVIPNPPDPVIIQTAVSETGEVWMAYNLGAERVASSISDTLAYGSMYQWGRATDGHEDPRSGIVTELADSPQPEHGYFIAHSSPNYDWLASSNDALWQGIGGMNNPCPNGFRLPTQEEFEAEVSTWETQDAYGGLASPLKFVAAGIRNQDGTWTNSGEFMTYWTSTIRNGTYPGSVYMEANIYPNSAQVYGTNRATSAAVRCIKN